MAHPSHLGNPEYSLYFIMKHFRTNIIIGVVSLLLGILIGGYFFTCFAVTDLTGRQNGLMLSLHDKIQNNQNMEAKRLIEYRIDDNLKMLQQIQKPNTIGLYYFNPSNIFLCYHNTSANTSVLKQFLLATPTELSASSISYLKNHNGP